MSENKEENRKKSSGGVGSEEFHSKSIARQYVSIAFPLTLSLIISTVYGIVDTYFVAQTGNTDLVAAVALCGPVFTLQMAIGNLFAQGSSSMISRLLGGNENERARHVSAFSFYAALATGVLIGILFLAFQGTVLKLLGTNAATRDFAAQYLRIIALGSPFAVLTFIHSNLLRAEGLSREAMIGNVSGSVINIILDPIFIPVWGAAGAAAATVLGHMVSVAALLFIVLKKSTNLSVVPSKISVTKEELTQVIGIGIPAAISNALLMLSTVVTNHFLVPYGNDRVAALGISARGVTIVSLVLTGFTYGGAPLFGYYFGAKDRKNLSAVYRFGRKLVIVLALSMSTVLFIIAPVFIRMFMDDTGIVRHGTFMFRMHLVTMVFAGLVSLYSIIFQSTGKIKASFFLSLARQGLIFLPVLIIMSAVFGYVGIVAAQSVTDVISFVCAIMMFRNILADDFRE